MKFDLHIHSNRSYDSLSQIDKIIEYAKKRQLNGIAITDHEAMVVGELIDDSMRDNIWIIRGSEMQTDIGDIIGLFISKELKSREAISLVDEIHDQNGIAILAHPFKRMDHYPTRILEKIDAVEVVNARWRDLSLMTVNPRVRELLEMVRGRSAGSDSHFSFEVGGAYWATPSLETEEDLKKSVCSGNGQGICNHCCGWLDNVSQGIKLLKEPSIEQFARMIYLSLKRKNPIARDQNLNG